MTFGAWSARCKTMQDASTACPGGSITTTPRRSSQRSPVAGAVPPWRGGELPSTSYRQDTTGDTTASWSTRASTLRREPCGVKTTLDHEASRWCCVRRCDRWEAGPSCVRERSRCRSPVETPRTPPRRRVALARRRARCHGGGGRFAAASSQQSRAKEGEAACRRRGVGPTIAHGGLQGGAWTRASAAEHGGGAWANDGRERAPLRSSSDALCFVVSIGPVLKRALPHSALGEPHLGDTRVVGHGIPYEAPPRCCRRRRAFVVRISPPWVPKTSEAGRGALPNSVLPNEEPMKPHEAFEALLPGTPPTQVVVGTGAANLIRRRAGHRLCSACLGWGA